MTRLSVSLATTRLDLLPMKTARHTYEERLNVTLSSAFSLELWRLFKDADHHTCSSCSFNL